MQAMIFAAGLGTRLHPLTKDRPKALAPFLDTTLLGYNLKFLSAQGIHHFVINTHHFREKIETYLEDNNYFGLDISLSPEEVLLDTAGGLLQASDLFYQDAKPVLLFNTDIITNLDIQKMLEYHNQYQNKLTLAVRHRKSSRELFFDDDQNLCGWVNHKTGQSIMQTGQTQKTRAFAFSGIHLIQPDLIRKIDQNRIYSLIVFYLEIMQNQQIKAFVHDEDYWFDCGRIEDLVAAENFLQKTNG